MMMLLDLVMRRHLIVVVWRVLVEHHVALMLISTVWTLWELRLVVVILSGGFVTLFPFAATILEPDLGIDEITNSLNNSLNNHRCLCSIENALENGSIAAFSHTAFSWKYVKRCVSHPRCITVIRNMDQRHHGKGKQGFPKAFFLKLGNFISAVEGCSCCRWELFWCHFWRFTRLLAWRCRFGVINEAKVTIQSLKKIQSFLMIQSSFSFVVIWLVFYLFIITICICLYSRYC